MRTPVAESPPFLAIDMLKWEYRYVIEHGSAEELTELTMQLHALRARQDSGTADKLRDEEHAVLQVANAVSRWKTACAAASTRTPRSRRHQPR